MKKPIMLAGLALLFISSGFAQSTDEKPVLVGEIISMTSGDVPGRRTEADHKAPEVKSELDRQNNAGYVRTNYKPNASLYSWVFGEAIHNALSPGQSGATDPPLPGPLKMARSMKSKENPGC